MTPADAAAAWLGRNGFATEAVEMDGRIHRLPHSCKPNGGAAGWYVLHPEPVLHGRLGCHRCGLEERFRHGNARLSESDRKRMRELEQKRRKEEEEEQEKAARDLAAVLPKYPPASASHPYLVKKGGIQPHGALEVGGALVLPLRDVAGKVWSAQGISAEPLREWGDRNKSFEKGCRLRGCFFAIGPIPAPRMVVCEGFATGASIHEATNLPVACAMAASNLKAVAVDLRRANPTAEIIIAADDDCRTEGNPGVTKAREAAAASRALLAIPDFSGVESEPSDSDFNDLAARGGLEAVRAGMEAAQPWPPPPEDGGEGGDPLPGNDEPPPDAAPAERPGTWDDISALAGIVVITPEPVVEGLLRRGETAVMGGTAKSFKSWAAKDLGLCVSHGLPWLGRNVTPGPVLIVNLELPRWAVRSRLMAIAAARGVTLRPDRLMVWTLRGVRDITAEAVRAGIPKEKRFALVVIDPAYKLLGGRDENSAGDIGALMAEFEAIAAETGAAVLIPAHFAKGDASQKVAMDRISGSGVFARAPDSVLTLTRHEEENAFSVESVLRTFPPVPPFVVRWQFPVFSLDGSLDPARLKKVGRAEKYSDDSLLACLDGKRLSFVDWRTAAEAATGIAERTFADRVKKLVLRDRVIKSATSEDYYLPNYRTSGEASPVVRGGAYKAAPHLTPGGPGAESAESAEMNYRTTSP